ncbi:Epidermal growth factor-like protein 7 [Takifugu flavidus]|uniref:Epidermal growth factor-like protein 7 n=1 Tax=Takifugu flavidus TaxID=433684 RepID=A0A5C6NH88_9TELE|nr:Epidermal growth factor-like protein 7 [Takifugu flavidus]
MYQTLLLSSYLFILHVMGTPPFMAPHGRRVCGQDVRYSIVMTTESYVQPVHKPYITLCQGHRLCSTYKTAYSVRYRQVSKAAPSSHFYPECCPGWRRLHSHHCNHDVDECKEQQPCAQTCVNTLGSYQCACREGSSLTGDGRSCQSIPSTPPPAPLPSTSQTPVGGHADAGGRIGLLENVTEEVQSLKSRVELLEKKLQMVLAPFTSVFPLSLDEGLSEKTTLLSHSFQQLDRIDSLSEQIGFLEERLGTCEFLSRELACEDTKSRARIFSPKQLPSLQKRAVPRFSMAPFQKMVVWSEGSKKKDMEKGNKGRMRREMVGKGPNMARGEGQKARRAASALVPLLGQDRLSSVVRTQLVSRRSCGRTGRSRRGEAGACVW